MFKHIRDRETLQTYSQNGVSFLVSMFVSLTRFVKRKCFFPIFELYSRYFEKMFDSCFVQGCSWSENKITKKQLKPSPPLSKWSFFTCFDGVQKQSENNFHGKISEIIKITDKKIIPGCKL